MESLSFDTRVALRTEEGKRTGLCCSVSELTLGDEFAYEGVRYLLTTKRVRFDECDSGYRIRYGRRSWYIVHRHGRENVLFPLVPSNDPFSTEWGRNMGTFPGPHEMVELLTFEELAVVAVLA